MWFSFGSAHCLPLTACTTPECLPCSPEVLDPKLFLRDSTRTCIIMGSGRGAPLPPGSRAGEGRWRTLKGRCGRTVRTLGWASPCSPSAGLHCAPPPPGITPQVSVCFLHESRLTSRAGVCLRRLENGEGWEVEVEGGEAQPLYSDADTSSLQPPLNIPNHVPLPAADSLINTLCTVRAGKNIAIIQITAH